MGALPARPRFASMAPLDDLPRLIDARLVLLVSSKAQVSTPLVLTRRQPLAMSNCR